MSLHRVAGNPQNLERIAAFLAPEELPAFAELDESIKKHFELEQGDLRTYFKYRYPFLRVCNVKKAQEVFDRVHRNPAYLRELNYVTKSTPAWHAFKDGKYELASTYLQWGGRLDATPDQIEQLCSFPSMLVEHPILSLRIRNAKWEAAKTNDQKTAVLQAMLEEYCLKGHLDGVRWVINKGFDLSLAKPLEQAIRGGFVDVLAELCKKMQNKDKSRQLVAVCLEMGYFEVFTLLKSFGFPVSDEQEIQMSELVKEIPHAVAFPQAPNANAHASHGGDSNKSIREKEYERMVVYAYNALRTGVAIRTIIDNLLHRRRRMAVLCKLTDLDNYGTPTKKSMGTGFDSSYKEYGDRIKAKYSEFPVKVTTRIGDADIPLTTITADRWEHPNGEHRDIILDEVARLCEPLRTSLQKDLATPLSQLIWLISHAPPSQRGTPIILRSLVDAICMLQRRKPIDPSYEINCNALVFADSQEFATELLSKSK